MSKPTKIEARVRIFIVSSAVATAVVVASPVPISAATQNPVTITAEAKTTKRQAKHNYDLAIKKAKSEYRQTIGSAKINLKNALANSLDKEGRIEAKKAYNYAIKNAQEKLNSALKGAKVEYQRTIS